MRLNYDEILKSYERIEKYIVRTPLEKSNYLSEGKTEIFLKMENRQKLNCCKLRGALSKITDLDNEELKRPIVAVSSGNHGISLSYVASLFNLKNVKIFVPITTPKNKIDKIRDFGADVIVAGRTYDEASKLAKKYKEENNGIFIDPCSDELALAGQGTIALEIIEDIPNIDMILVPLGGGGIIGGVGVYAKAINPNIKVIGIQTEKSPSMYESLRDNIRYESFETKGFSICDSLLGGVGETPYSLAKEIIDDILLVNEEYIKKSIYHLAVYEKNIVEPSGAIGLGAYFQYRDYFKNKKSAIILSGGNIDENLFLEILNKK